MAGKRKGKEDERHLWPEMLRTIREIKPTWVVGENVFGITNWDGGVVFNEVQADLEAEGYEVQPYVLPACAVNAPHRRDRVWFVSRLITNSGRSGCDGDSKLKEWRNGERERISQHESDALCSIGVTPDSRLFGQERSGEQTAGVEQCNKGGVTADTGNQGLEGCKVDGGIGKVGAERDKQPARCVPPNWQNFPTISPLCGGDDGLPLDLVGITFSKWRNESIKAMGNAIVPQVAMQIFKAINEYNNLTR